MGAIVFLPREGNEPSLMLEELLFDPAALWLSESLRSAGVQRFFVVCHDDDREAAIPCFPEGTEFVTTGTADATERLSEFLSQQEGKVVVILRPIQCDPPTAQALLCAQEGARLEDKDTGVCRIDAKALASALSEGLDFDTALRTRADKLGNHSVWFQDVSPLRHGWEARLQAEFTARQSSVSRLIEQGVRIIDPNNVYVGPCVSVGKGTRLLPNTILKGATSIGEGCEIGPNTTVDECIIGDNVSINSSELHESRIESGTKVGPFAYIRPHCYVGRDVKVGDFVELKNSTIGNGTKISHLTYVGDSDVGEGVNFGCGTVTVNYDGSGKFRTTIGNHAFIGCNTNLVAPVKIGENAYTAAGSTITNEVPGDSLAIARSAQVIKKQWVIKRKKRK